MESLFISQTENGNFLNDETYFKSRVQFVDLVFLL